jgi:hypothetical protein
LLCTSIYFTIRSLSLRVLHKWDEGSLKSLKPGNLVYHSISWWLNSRWPQKFDLLLKSTNRLFYRLFLFNRLSKYLAFIEKKITLIPGGAHIQYGVFFGIFFRSFHIRQKLKNIFCIYSWRTNSKNEKFCCPKINSKWPLNSRWLPKLNFLVKTTNHLFSKKNFRAVLIA